MASSNVFLLYLFGTFRVLRRETGEEVYISSQRARWLLSLLALEFPRNLPRSYIAGLLWPDMPETRARHALSQAIWRIRRALSPDVIATQGETVALSSTLWADVIEFQQKVQSQDVSQLQEAVALYAGDFLPECYEDWALLARERLRERYVSALHLLFEVLRKERRYEEALACAREIVRMDPLREDGYRALMELCLVLDRPRDALQQYNTLRTLLLEELGVEPSPELQVLRDTARQRMHQDARAGPAPIFTPNAYVPFVGRHKERRALLDAVEQAIQGRGGVVLVEARQGMGKTRLLNEVRAGAEWRGMHVGYAQASEVTEPFSPLKEAVPPLFTPSCLSALRSSVAEPLLNTAAHLWPVLGSPAEDVHPRQLYHAVARVLIELARCVPVALLLDDIHNGDLTVLEILETLLPDLNTVPLLIVLAYRPLEARARAGLWERMLALDRDAAFQRIALEPFDDEEQRVFISAALNIPREHPVLDRLTAICGHVPLYIVEVLRYLRRRGNLRREANGEWQLDTGDTMLPPTVAGLVQHRVRFLPEKTREVLELLAVMGERIPADVLNDVLAPRYNDLPAILHDMSRHGFIVYEDGAYRFSHALVREAVYESLSVERRRALHRFLAEMWRQREPVSWASVAYHAQEGGNTALAVHAHLRAAEEAMRRHAHEQVVYHCDAALSIIPPGDVALCDLWRMRGEALMLLGQKREARSALARSIWLARCMRNPYRLAQAVLKAGVLSIRQGRPLQAERFLRRALSLFKTLNARQEMAEALTFLADVEETLGNLEQALSYVQTAAKETEAAPQSRQRMHVFSRWAVISARMGHLEEAAEHYERAVSLAREIGDLYGQGYALNGLGLLALTARDHPRAREIFAEVIRVAERLGDHHNISVTRLNQAVVEANSGHFVEARDLGEEALALCRRAHNRSSEVLSLLLLGNIHGAWGEWERAEAYRKEAEEIAHRVAFRAGLAYAWRDRSTWHRRRGEIDEAIRWGERSTAYFLETGMHEKLPMAAYHYALALVDGGEVDRAVDVLQKALVHTRSERPRAILKTCLAAAMARQGRSDKVRRILDQVLPVVRRMTTDEYLPEMWYHISFAAQEFDPSLSTEAIRLAYVVLRGQCLHVPEERHAAFLYTVAPHRRIAEAWLQQAPRPVERLRLTLPALTGDGEVIVIWTVDAGDEDAIVEATQGPTALRRYRLSRLLREAKEQGARPSHRALADALGVSVPTIRRDLRSLRDAQR